jgi:asparagine synthase (glutamine-hydrolysing)
MCGIAGFFNYDGKNRDEVLKSMSKAIAHRGPDGEGSYLNEEVGLAHRRLMIIDLNTGAQPMFSADKRFITIFNGEIYNYRELRERLKNKQCDFNTDSDTEVIAAAISAWGIEKACCEFRGMFAFACYDIKKKKLYLARDRTGVKPLYFAELKGALFFASEQKSILTLPNISRYIDPVALNDTLSLGFPLTPATCWRDIKMFPPAHYSEITLAERSTGKHLIPKKYWQWEYRPEKMELTDALAMAESVLSDSLKFHLRSDVPLASFLSGGIDSSLLVALLSKGSLIDSLKTFNVGFDERKYDESSDARHVAAIAGTEHHEILMESSSGDPEEFERILSQYDEPYGDSSCLPTYLISRKMRKHVKVVISGDGGDELFGGYDRFVNVAKIASLRSLPFKSTLRSLLPLGASLLGGDNVRRLKNALDFAIAPEKESFALLHTYFHENEKCDLYTPEFAALAMRRGPTSLRYSHFIPQKSFDIASQLMDTELAINLHADYLRKVDIASSAHGLEVRVPFLDSEVMDFAARVPMELKIKNGKLKYLLRELARRKISDRIADKGKWGFGIPFDNWCGAEMIEYLNKLLFGSDANNGIWQIFNQAYGKRLFALFTKTESANLAEISRFQIYQRIFLLASTQIWFKTYKPEI